MSESDKETPPAKEISKAGASKGGQKRAENLTPEERSEIARKAAEARWNKGNNEELPVAEYPGQIHIGETTISCAVLDDRRRILSERSINEALGGNRPGSHWRRRKDIAGGDYVPMFVSAGNLAPFIPPSLAMALAQPIRYRNASGSIANTYGVVATLLPEICTVWLRARREGGLLPSQEHIAAQAEILQGGLAQVGIVALVDEATGYQEVRDRNELNRILEAYISKELLPWTKRFPDEYYQELFRLRGWSYNPVSVKRPQFVGKLTNEIVYDKLPPGVLDELKRLNPTDADGHRKYHHHRLLTDDVGNVHLQKQLVAVTTLMRISSSWASFKRLFDKAFPTDGQLSLPGVDDDIEED